MASPSGRLAWPDVAKGISILGVVLLHVTIAVPDAQHSTLAQMNVLFDPLRMPLFFLISGFFSSKVFRLTFRELFTRRLWYFLVPYVVWVPMELYLKSMEYRAVFEEDMRTFGSYVYHVAFGVNMAWFLYALMLFNIALWLVRRWPAWAAMLASLLPLLTLPWHFDYHMLGKAVLYLPIFFFGVYARRAIRHFGDRCLEPTYLAGSAVLYAIGLLIHLKWANFRATNELIVPWPFLGPDTIDAAAIELVVRLSTHFLMLGAAITLSVVVSKIVIVSQSLQFIGRHTLPVYIGHPIALTALYHFTQYRLQLPISDDADHWISSTGFWMFACFLISIVGGIGLWSLSRVPVLGWVVTPPPIHSGLAVRTPGTARRVVAPVSARH